MMFAEKSSQPSLLMDRSRLGRRTATTPRREVPTTLPSNIIDTLMF